MTLAAHLIDHIASGDDHLQKLLQKMRWQVTAVMTHPVHALQTYAKRVTR